MRCFPGAGLAGFFVVCTLMVGGCSSSSDDGTAVSPVDTDPRETESSPVSEGSENAPVNDAAGSVPADDGDTPSAGAVDGASAPADDAVASPEGDAAATGGTDDIAPNALAEGNAEDTSPTETESRSLAGPFITDPSRGAGPPSAPADLTALLIAGDWLEFSWTPSTDDQSVEAYEIYRDGSLLRTVTNAGSPESEYRYWLSTSYIDCNYTRDVNCQTQQPAVGSTHEYYVVAVDNEGQRSQPSESATFTLNSLEGSSVDLANYELVFSDEFEGDSLDVEKWKTALPWGPDTVINGEMQYFVNIFGSDPIDFNPFSFDGESLSINGSATPPELLAGANNQPYLSGVITSSDKFAMTYGYVEMRARLAAGNGLLSTFYLFNDDFERNKPEIDIIEYIGNRPDKAYQTYHYYDSNRARNFQGEKHSSPTMETPVGVNLSADFHTYAVSWEPGVMVWYLDGQEVRRITGPRVSDEPMHIVTHLVVGSEWIGPPDASTVLPASMQIDYIRAYGPR